MIRQLRIKFVTIIMAVVTFLLIIIFTSLYITSKVDFRKDSMDDMRFALRETYPPDGKTETAGPAALVKKRSGSATLVVNVRSDGGVEVLKNRLHEVDEGRAAELIALVSEMEEKSGELPSLGLRYIHEPRGPGNERYVFIDITVEQNSLRAQLISSVVIGILSFGAFLFAACKISGWVIRPVQEAWDHQREFIADASHELKTPLTVVLANTNLLLESDSEDSGDSGKAAKRLENIRAESLRMKELIEQLLILARSDNRREEQHEALNFSYLTESVLLRFEPLIFDLGKQLEYNIAECLQVSGCKNNLCQLLEILLDNACKYGSEAGKICVRLELLNGRDILLLVENSGRPISKEELSRIFDRFYRSDRSRSHTKGYGLGLSIAAGIVAAHGGKIWAESDGVSKNRFLVKLPVKPAGGHRPCNPQPGCGM